MQTDTQTEEPTMQENQQTIHQGKKTHQNTKQEI